MISLLRPLFALDISRSMIIVKQVNKNATGDSVSRTTLPEYCETLKRPSTSIASASGSPSIVTPNRPQDHTMETGAVFPLKSMKKFTYQRNCSVKGCNRYANQEKTLKILNLNAYPTLNLCTTDGEFQMTFGNSVSSTEPPKQCETTKRPSATATTSDRTNMVTMKRPRVTDHSYARQSIDIKVEQDVAEGSRHLENEASGSGSIIPGFSIITESYIGLSNERETKPPLGLTNKTEPYREFSNKMELSHDLVNIKQEPDDQLEIHDSVDITEETHQLIQLESIDCNELEIKQECNIVDDRQEVEIKQETDDDFETYPNVVPPETIFLDEFPLEGTVKTEYSLEQPSECEDEIQITSVCSLAPPHSSTEATKRVNLPIPGTSKEVKVPSCSTCKLTFKSLTSFLNHECETLIKLHTGSMWRCEIWQCEFCNNVFDSERSLESHVKKKHEQRNVSAPVTNTPSNTQIPIFSRAIYEEFYTHLCMYHVKSNGDGNNRMIANSLLIEFIEEDNLKGKVHKCIECAHTIYTTKEYFNYHFKAIHKCNMFQDFVSCKVCSKCHKEVNKMEAHIKKGHMEYWKHRVDENSLYCCATCEDKFASCLVTENNYGLMTERSIDLKHFEVTRIVATAGKFYFKYNIKQHCDHFSHNYTCALCKPALYFPTEKELNLHLQSHSDDIAFRTCALCSKPCYNMNEFYNHVKDGCVDSELNFEHYQRNDSQKTSCRICSVVLVNPCSRKIHELVCHASKTFDPQLPDGKYVCPICKVKFSNPKHFFAHCSPYYVLFREMSTTYCDQCSISFQSSTDFKEHSIRRHGEANCFKCKICDFGLEYKTPFHKHVSKEHNTPLIHCTQCFANVRIKPNVTITHFRSCNTRTLHNERLYSCPICGLRLETYNTLINHIKIDMQLLTNKKFQCKHCFNYFFTAYNLCAHIVNGKCKTCNLPLCGKQKLAEHSTSPCVV
ncbi:hypothetical protein B566_EDAN004670 [Ephemera danica]|nr:hypothetical protein B566_EDAN004670 [Ephemera danica]